MFSCSFCNITTSLIFPDSAQSDVISNRVKCLMKYPVGTPLVPILGIANMGSDLIWLQCKPCTECSNQTAPLFDPEMSTTYKSVSCTSSQCESLAKISCSNDGTSCQYSISCGDGSSFSKGDPSMDTLTLGSTTSHPMPLPIIWCGHDNVGNFDDKGSDIVGIGGRAVSLVSQLSSSIGGKFSYCLVPLTSRDKNSSKLNFGSDAVVSGPGTVSTPLVPKILDTYLLTLDVTP